MKIIKFLFKILVIICALPIAIPTFIYILCFKSSKKLTKMENEIYLTLKWGTLKSWDFTNSEKGQSLLKEYYKIGCCYSVMAQNDTPRQKQIICELIDLCDGDTIYLEWDDKDVPKQEAKDYVLNYRRNG